MNDRGVTWLLGGFGLAVIAVGIVGAALDWELNRAAWFLLAGCALVALGVLHPRLTSVNVEVAGTKFGALFSTVVVEAGSVAAVEIERLGMADLAAAYQFINLELRDEGDTETRIRLQDALIDEARTRSVAAAPNKRALRAAMLSSSSAARAIALGVAQAHPGVASLKALTPNITASLSGNEQYQAIRVAELMVPRLGDKDLRRMRQVLVAADTWDDPDRITARDRVLAAIADRLGGGSQSPAQ